jgi:hypothetical protein
MTRPPPEPARCAVCGASGAHPSEGQRLPLCAYHEQAWLHSPERARAATARADFVRRRRAELRTPSSTPKAEEDDPWNT